VTGTDEDAWLIQAPSLLTAGQITSARQAAVAAGLVIESGH
jgi:hypothetical protein